MKWNTENDDETFLFVYSFFISPAGVTVKSVRKKIDVELDELDRKVTPVDE